MSDIIIDLNSSPKYNFLLDLQGESLYQKWLALGNTGTESDFIYWLRFTGDGTYEPVITTKKTAFNVDFGTTAGTAADGGVVQNSLSNKQSTSSKNQANGYAGLGSDGKLISSQLPSITVSDTFVVSSQSAMLAIAGETGDVAVRTDLNKSFILKGTDPTVLANWQELLTPTSDVTSVFGRNGSVTANAGDYNADQITETTTRKFQTANQKLFNDATSSIQTQLNARLTGSMNTGRIPRATGATSFGDSLIYDNGTNVGIGTTNPGEKLEVAGNVLLPNTASKYAFASGGYGWLGYPNETNGMSIAMSSATRVGGLYQMSLNSQAGFKFGNSTESSIFFNIASSGEATFSSSVTVGSFLKLGGAGTFSPPSGLSYGLFPYSNYGLGMYSEAGGMGFWGGSTPVENMRINNNGTVKISTLGTGTVYSNSGVLTNINPSDERLKDEITDISYGLNEILQLRPVTYNWKNDTIKQGKQFGFIAQEVQKLMPELVKEFKTKDGKKDVTRLGLDKEAIFTILVNAIQELNKKIQTLN
jgi:hypothetical protein